MNDAEDSRIRSDAEGHDEDRNTGKAWTLTEQPDSESHVSYQSCHVAPPLPSARGNLHATLQGGKERIIKTLIQRQTARVFNARNRCPVPDIGASSQAMNCGPGTSALVVAAPIFNAFSMMSAARPKPSSCRIAACMSRAARRYFSSV